MNRKMVQLAAFAAGLLFAAPAFAYIGLVTVPDRDGVQVTVYNSEDLTLVQERRTLTFKKGMNELEFSWVNTLIDPTSIQLDFADGAKGLKVMDTTFPKGRGEALVWHIESEREQTAAVAVSYFTSGLSWEADYLAVLNESESKADLEGWVKVSNRSGETYEEAETRLVVGTIRLVEPVADIAQRYRQRSQPPGYYGLDEAVAYDMPEAAAMPMMEMEEGMGARKRSVAKAALRAPKEIQKEAASEFFLYSIEGTETIPDQGARRMISLRQSGVPVDITYKLDPDKYGPQMLRFITTKNDTKSKLGKEPLPNGMFRVYKNETGGNKAFLGQAAVEYVPVNEDIEVNLGDDPEVTFEEKPTDFRRADLHYGRNGEVDGYTEIRTFEITVKNAKTIPAKFEIKRNMEGDWSVETSQSYEKKDMRTIEFKFDLAPRSEKVFTYIVTTLIGKNSRGN